MRSRVFLALVLFAALIAPAQARRVADGETLDRILPQIRAAHPGRLSDAEPWVDESGRTHYRIKWMTPEGRILYFDADARSGQYSSSGGDEGRDWRGTGDRYRGHDGYDPGDEGGRRYWNDGGERQGGGDWRDRSGGGDWRGGHGDGRGGGGDNGRWHHHDRGGN